MTDEITPELFEHLVDLAAFAFDPKKQNICAGNSIIN